jgi:hypothetical protein
MKLKRIINIARHRNGVGGAPFDVVLFTDTGEDGSRKVAILFEMASFCAVLDVDKLAKGDIAFGSNSWRGDHYEPPLRKAIERCWRERPEGVYEHTPQIDIEQLLRQRRQVAVIWSIDDIQEVRPDLTDDQAWQVLQCCHDKHDGELGLTWTTIEIVADDLFPEPSATNKE